MKTKKNWFLQQTRNICKSTLQLKRTKQNVGLLRTLQKQTALRLSFILLIQVSWTLRLGG